MLQSISRQLLSLTAIAALCAMPMAADGGVIIDDFENNFHIVESGNGNIGMFTDTETGIPSSSLAGTIGGARTLQLNVSESNSNRSSLLEVNSTLFFENGVNQVANGMVTWDGDGAGLGGIDITDGGGATHLLTTIIFSDQDLTLQIDITDTSAGVSSYAATLDQILSPEDKLIPLVDFSGTADLTQVDSIKLTLFGPTAQDAELSFLGTTSVPEPMSLLVWAFASGVGGLGYYRKRRKVK